jgi:hypothetical protein
VIDSAIARTWMLSNLMHEADAWDDFVRWIWRRCTDDDADDLGLPAPPDVDAALLALCDHIADCAEGRCLTCALAELARHCPDCDAPGFECGAEHVVVPMDVPTSRPLGEADNFPVVGIGCGGTVAAPVRTIGRDR